MLITRSPRRALAATAAALGLVVVLATPALAHVEASGSTEGSVTTVTFSFEHGCKGSPTTSLRVQLPTGTTQVTAQDPAGFTSQVSATEIAWTGGSVPDATKGTFVASMTLTAGPGTTVYFPTIQGCAQGSNDWIEIPQAGQPEPEFVAPSITIGSTAPAGEHDHDKPTTTVAEHDHDNTGTTAEHDHDKPAATSAPATSAPATSAPGTTVAAATPAASSSNTGLLLGIGAAVIAVVVIVGIVVGRGRRSTPET